MKKHLLICLLAMIGCIIWTSAGSADEHSFTHFSVDLPQGWRQINTNKYLLITKNDPFLQYVLIQRRPIDQAFKHTRKKLKNEMLPHEVAQVIIDEIFSDHHILDFNVIENIPASIDGHEGFKLLFTYKDKKGSSFKTVYYGLIQGDAFYNLRYNAVQKDYFDKDIETFQIILDSFRLQ